MAGHSKFKNIMHRKGAQDAKRAKSFTKLIRELTVAAKSGPDPDANPRLRSAISAARNANMPKDTIERAISRGSGGEETDMFQEVRYEGYAPGGIAVIVEALTDNRNRTAAEIRAAFNKFGGNLGEMNSVTFMFDRVGAIQFPATVASVDEMFEAALEAGAQNVDSSEETHDIQCAPDDLHTVREGLSAKFGDPLEAHLSWMPQNTIQVEKEAAETLLKLLNTLEENDDVQSVSANYDISEEILQELGGGNEQ